MTLTWRRSPVPGNNTNATPRGSAATHLLVAPFPTIVVIVIAMGIAMGIVGCESAGGREDESLPDGRQRAKIQTQLGIGYMREGQNETAYERLTNAVKADPTYAPAHNALALLFERLKQVEEAGKHYELATRLDPTFAAAQNNYGGWLCRERRFEAADAWFAKSASNPLYEVPQLALFNAGVCMQKQGRIEQATQYFRRSLDKEPKFAQALYAMSEISLNANNHLSARAYLQRYLEVAPHTPRTLWLGVRIERALNDKNAVSSYSMLLRSKYPDSPETKKLRDSESQ